MLDFKDPDMKIVIADGHGDRIIDLNKELAIDPSDLNKELIEQSSKYAWYGTLYSNAKHDFEEAKNQLGVIESNLDKNIREESEYDGKKKPTEAAITRYIHGDDQYIKALVLINEKKKKVDVLAYVLKAFDQKMDALITLGANVRNEQKQFGIDKISE